MENHLPDRISISLSQGSDVKSSANKLVKEYNDDTYSTRNNYEVVFFFTRCFMTAVQVLRESPTSLVDGYSTEGPLAFLRHHEPAERGGCVH